MNVLINGIGNLGTTLVNLLVEYRTELGIERVILLKNNLHPWQKSDLDKLEKKGCEIFSKNVGKFPTIERVLADIHFVFDTTANGGGRANKAWYQIFPSLIGACAQGSEKGFGLSHMIDVNNEQIEGQKFVHIVSCNTHGIASLINTFSDDQLHEIETTDFVVARRSEDIGNHERLVSGNVVARHLDDRLGTHHAIDVVDLYKTMNESITVTSSDITTPSQVMHGVRFNIQFKKEINEEEIRARLTVAPFVSTTVKFDSNVIFELGRRYGLQGRIYSHAIVVSNNILFEERGLKGWAFIPQEGNTLLSTMNAFLLQTKNKNASNIISRISSDLIEKIW
jgi:glyceraldehyde-3-phosphate dehydrogenase (NAD(P))